jgi:hypothetical protein
MLSSHLETCTDDLAPTKVSCEAMRVELRKTNGTSSTSSTLLIIARSSSVAPKAWYADTPSVVDGLPVFGNLICFQYEEYRGSKPETVILHGAYEVASKNMPAMAENKPPADAT